MKHTKGTWVKGTNTAKKDWMKVYCNNKLIAEVKELSKKGERKATDFEEEAANLALIAAAPELLDALKAQLPIYELIIKYMPQYYSSTEHERVKNAIKKATL